MHIKHPTHTNHVFVKDASLLCSLSYAASASQVHVEYHHMYFMQDIAKGLKTTNILTSSLSLFPSLPPSLTLSHFLFLASLAMLSYKVSQQGLI